MTGRAIAVRVCDEFAGAVPSELRTELAQDQMEEPMAFRPYLFFGGNCREAFTRYQEIFGGELTLMTMKDVPGEEPPADKADMIIHAALTLGDDLLMASDDPMSDSFGPVQGMMVSYDAADVADANAGLRRARRWWQRHPGARADLLLRGLRHVRRPVRHALDGRRPAAAAAVLISTPPTGMAARNTASRAERRAVRLPTTCVP